MHRIAFWPDENNLVPNYVAVALEKSVIEAPNFPEPSPLCQSFILTLASLPRSERQRESASPTPRRRNESPIAPSDVAWRSEVCAGLCTRSTDLWTQTQHSSNKSDHILSPNLICRLLHVVIRHSVNGLTQSLVLKWSYKMSVLLIVIKAQSGHYHEHLYVETFTALN